MPKITAQFKLIKLDKQAITKDIERRANSLNKKATRECVRAIILKVPVWTGMARGSIKLAKGRSGESAGRSLFEFLRLSIPIIPVASVLGKTPETGGKQARYTFSHYHGKYTFTLNTNVIHYIINEWYDFGTGSAGYPRPWHSFRAGKEAYDDYIRQHGKEAIPKVKDFVTFVDVPVQ